MRRVDEIVSSSLSNTLINMQTWDGVMYNVLEYDIVNDGITDNTSALQSLISTAIAAGRKAIFYPAGLYYVTALTNDDNVVFLGDNAYFVGGYNGYIQQLGDKDYTGVARQAVINGNFNIWQRGTTISNPATPQYTSDRWFSSANSDGGVFPATIDHLLSAIVPGDVPGSLNSYRLNLSGVGSGFGTNASCGVFQRIEFGTRYLCGLGKKVSVSFWARSSIASKKIGLSLSQRYGTSGSPSASELVGGKDFTLTSTWKRYKFTFETLTLSGKTFGTDNNDYLQFGFLIMWGATAGVTFGLPGTEGFGSAGYIDIAQVQINSGSSDLPFYQIPPSEELSMCQRFYERFDGTGGGGQRYYNNGAGAGNIGVNVLFRVTKRSVPTVSLTYDINDGAPSTVTPAVIVKDGFVSVISAVPSGQFVDIQSWNASSEL